MNKRVLFSILVVEVFLLAPKYVLADQLPIGWQDPPSSTACTITGWTCDSDDLSVPLQVNLYRNSSSLIDQITASTTRNLLGACGTATNHGFVGVRLPMFFNDDTAWQISANAIGIDSHGNPTGGETSLSGNPQTIQCAYTPFQGPQEVEPNNTFSKANGPIEFGNTYQGNFDPAGGDLYKVYLTPGQVISVTLNTNNLSGVQMILYYVDGTDPVAYDDGHGRLTYTVLNFPGWYYLYVYEGLSNTAAYSFTVNAAYPITNEVEPDNSFATANGPLQFGTNYSGTHDLKDYFKMYLTTGQHISTTLTGTNSSGVQLQLYWKDGNSLQDTAVGPPFDLNYMTPANGWYYFYISTDPTKNNTSAYTLRVSLNLSSPTPSPSPGYTIAQLKTLLTNYFSNQDQLYNEVNGVVNSMDASYVMNHL